MLISLIMLKSFRSSVFFEAIDGSTTTDRGKDDTPDGVGGAGLHDIDLEILLGKNAPNIYRYNRKIYSQLFHRAAAFVASVVDIFMSRMDLLCGKEMP